MGKEHIITPDAISHEEAIRDWEAAADEFASRFERREEFFHKHMINPVMLELIGPVAGKRIIDVACGEGHFTRKLAELAKGNVRITGIDISQRLIEIASQKNTQFPDSITYMVGDASAMHGVPSNSYDIAVCNMALMFIKRYEEVFAEVSRVLRPGGAFVFSLLHPCFLTPGSDWIVEERGGKLERVAWRTDNYHLRLVARAVMIVCDTKETYYFCRTLEDYMRAMRASGMVIADLREPLPPKALMARRPDFQAEAKRGLFLIMKGVLLQECASI